MNNDYLKALEACARTGNQQAITELMYALRSYRKEFLLFIQAVETEDFVSTEDFRNKVNAIEHGDYYDCQLPQPKQNLGRSL